jgi:hypothetical protein
LDDLNVIFQCEEFAALPRVLYDKSELSEITRKAAMTVEEILLANLGDAHVEPHLIVSPFSFIAKNVRSAPS